MGLVARRGHQRTGFDLDEIPGGEELPQSARQCACAQKKRPAVGMTGPEGRWHGAALLKPARGRCQKPRKSLANGRKISMVRPDIWAAPASVAAAGQLKETHRESHRQLASQGQYRRTRRQALRRSQRRKLPPRQGHPHHPDRHAPDQRRRKGGAALQDDRAGRTRPCGRPRASVPLPGRRRLPFHEYGELRPGHAAGRHHRRSGRLPRSRR